MRRLVAFCLMLLAMPAAAQELKLVMQTAGQDAFDAAAWTPDGRWLIEASGYGRIVRIWDPEADVIVDSIRLPLPGTRADEKLVLDGMTVSADGRRARLEAVLVMESTALGPVRYEAIDFDIDLVTRKAVSVPTKRDAGAPSDTIPDLDDVPLIDAGRPVLPAAPDGRRLVRAEEKVLIRDAAGAELGALTFGRPADTNWASLSPDGSMILFLSPKPEPAEAKDETAAANGDADERITRLVVLNIAAGQAGPYGQTWDNYGEYGRVGWAGDGRVLLSETSTPQGRESGLAPWAKGDPATGWLIDLSGAREPLDVGARCFLQTLGRDRLVGAGLASCRHGVGADGSIWVRPLEGAWTRLPLQIPEGQYVNGLRASPDGTLIAVALGSQDMAGKNHLLLVDSTTGAIRYALADEAIDALVGQWRNIIEFDFLADGRSLLLFGSEAALHWRFADGVHDRLPATDPYPSLIVSDGKQALFGGVMSPGVQRVVLGRGAGGATAAPPLEVISPVAGGFISGKPILWVSSSTGELMLFDSRDWSLIATVRRFHDEDGEEYFVIHDPAGRYDSNLPPDFAPFRWLVTDAPFQSLGPQTFMRELYTPDLLSRLLDCVPQRSCAKALPFALNVSDLNRTLPEVVSMVISAGKTAGTVDVGVQVREGDNLLPSGAYGKSRSGMHNLRLFRDGVLVAEAGAADPGLDPADKAAWRAATRLTSNRSDMSHVAMFRDIKLASGSPAKPAVFSAYAFNEDRVRGEELTREIDPPLQRQLAKTLAKPRPRRLFLLSIGVDAYPGGVFRPLRYAVADARAMGGLFRNAFVNPREKRPMQVVELRVEGTAEQPATRAQIAEAFARLSTATPDDMVVMSFSGHGYTDGKGRFSLVPSDVRTQGDQPVRDSLIGADDLARWLMPVDAGSIYLVIDACHSAASVQSGGFKPGPMGDPGLGQLAYDKGIRILSASAPDQFAMEDTALGHGLLTYALVVEGAHEGKADADADKLVTLDELMAYAVKRLPAMGDPTDPLDGPGLVVEWAGPPVPKQTPKLFDFAVDWSPLAVRDLHTARGGEPARP
jgi:hypothetical protein